MFKSIKPDLPLAKSGRNNRYKMRPFIARTTTPLWQTPAKIQPMALTWGTLVFDLIVVSLHYGIKARLVHGQDFGL